MNALYLVSGRRSSFQISFPLSSHYFRREMLLSLTTVVQVPVDGWAPFCASLLSELVRPEMPKRCAHLCHCQFFIHCSVFLAGAYFSWKVFIGFGADLV